MDKITKSHLLDMKAMCDEAVSLREAKLTGALCEDRIAELAALHLIQTIGECAIRLDKSSPNWRDLMPEIPWSSIVSMRHRIVHAYDDIQGFILIDVLENGIPQLVLALNKILGK